MAMLKRPNISLNGCPDCSDVVDALDRLHDAITDEDDFGYVNDTRMEEDIDVVVNHIYWLHRRIMFGQNKNIRATTLTS